MSAEEDVPDRSFYPRRPLDSWRFYPACYHHAMPSSDSGAALKALARAIDLQQRGRLDEAEAVYAELLAAHPHDTTALINAGVLALARRDVASALRRLEKASRIVPTNSIALANLGFALVQAGRYDEAIDVCDRALRLKPDSAHALNTRGIALVRLGRSDEAVRAFRAALDFMPAYAEAALNLGESLNRSGDAAGARAAYQGVLARDANHAVARTGIAFADALEGRLEDAASALEAVVRDHPDHAPAWQTLGAVCNWAWRHEEAERAFHRALALDDANRDARFGIASTLLARGRYAEGFAAFEDSRRGLEPGDPLVRKLPRWDGAMRAQTLVLHGEQGLGDVVQFARFVAQVRPRVERIVLVLDGYWAPLAPLLASLQGVDEVVTDARMLREADSAARASILSLPHFTSARSDALPAQRYLAAPADRLEAWRRRLEPIAKPRVGLAWSVHARDDHAYVSRHKSIQPEAIARVLDVPGVSFVSLQPGAAGDPSTLGARASRVLDSGRQIRDFADTAALIENVDLTISADTAVAHVAGALGKPVWLLDRFNACWRWRLQPDTSPWYPTLRIFRQPRLGDWSSAIDAAIQALRARFG